MTSAFLLMHLVLENKNSVLYTNISFLFLKFQSENEKNEVPAKRHEFLAFTHHLLMIPIINFLDHKVVFLSSVVKAEVVNTCSYKSRDS